MKRVLLGAVVVMALEAGGWVLDARYGFRDELLETLTAFDYESDPAGAANTLMGPSPRLSIRVKGKPTPEDAESDRARSESMDSRTIEPADLAGQGGRKVFIVGESVAFGYPYPFRDSLEGLLESRPRLRGYRFITAAHTAYTSSQVAEQAERILSRYEPYALVVYTGNNEWIHWRPSAQPWMPGTELALLRGVAHSRAVAAVLDFWFREVVTRFQDRLRGLHEGYSPHHPEESVDYALKYPLESLGPFDPDEWAATKRRYLANFGTNLTKIASEAGRRKVKVAFLTMPFNYRLQPAWKHPQPKAFVAKTRDEVSRSCDDAAVLVRANQCREALGIIDHALSLDPNPSVLHYMKAQCLERAGSTVEAEAEYALSRENMIGNLGSMLSIDEIIAKVGTAGGARVVDVRKIFDDFEHARGRGFDDDLFHDDCHPNPAGIALVADAVESWLIASEGAHGSAR